MVKAGDREERIVQLLLAMRTGSAGRAAAALVGAARERGVGTEQASDRSKRPGIQGSEKGKHGDVSLHCRGRVLFIVAV